MSRFSDAETAELADELIRRLKYANRNGVTDFRMQMISWLKRLKKVAEREPI